jgi:hypothetical protein
MSASSVQLKKLWWAGPLTVLASIVGVLLVRALARLVLQPPYAPGLQMIMLPVVLTLVLCTAAVLVFVLVGRFAKKPVLTYLIISVVFLIISFLPDLAVASAPFPGSGWPYAIALMVMHVVAGVITVLMLTRLTAVEKA